MKKSDYVNMKPQAMCFADLNNWLDRIKRTFFIFKILKSSYEVKTSALKLKYLKRWFLQLE